MIREIGELVGWFDPGTKRFIYDADKKDRPDRYKNFTVPVHAIHEDPTHPDPAIAAVMPPAKPGGVCLNVPLKLVGQTCLAMRDAAERLSTGVHFLQDCIGQIENLKRGDQ